MDNSGSLERFRKCRHRNTIVVYENETPLNKKWITSQKRNGSTSKSGYF